MTIEFKYMEELKLFLQLFLLGGVLSVAVMYLTEAAKKWLKAFKFCAENTWLISIICFVISMAFGAGWKATFAADTIGWAGAVWLGLFLYLGSTGMYSKLEESDGVLGKTVQSYSKYVGEIGFGKTENVSVGDESTSDSKVKLTVEPKIEDKTNGETESTVTVDLGIEDKTEAEASTVEGTGVKDGEVGATQESAVGSPAKVGVATEPKITKTKPAGKAKVGDKAEAKRFKQGDIVTFAGGNVYKSPTDEEAAAFRGSGRCKITEPVADNGVPRYHLISEGKYPNGKVYGWVDGKDIKEHPDYQNDAEDTAVSPNNEICRFPVYYDSLGKRFVYVSAQFQKGIHDGADFGRCSDCKGERPVILACESGTVVQIRNSYKDTAGKFIKIESDHGNEVVTWQYKHLHEILVKTGDKIAVGEKIGIMGDTGGEYSDSVD